MPFSNPALRGQNENSRQAQMVKIAALEKDVWKLFDVLEAATDPASHTPEEIRGNQGALAGDLDNAIDRWAAALKELVRL